MKRLIRLTESDVCRMVRNSVNRILREADDIDSEGLRDSLIDYVSNPVDINKDVDYDPSDDEINAALKDFNPDDFDLDFSGLYDDGDDLGYYDDGLDVYESKRKMGKIIRESIRKVLNEGDMYKNGMLTQDGVISVNNTNVGNRQKELSKKYTPDFKKRKVKK